MFYRKHLLVFLLLTICFVFLSFVNTAEAAQFGKGWYRNSITADSTCPSGQWQAKIDVFDTDGAPLSVNTIQISAIIWQDTTGDGTWDRPNNFYNNSFSNLQSVDICIPVMESQQDMMVLQVTVSKNGYKTIYTYQKGRNSGIYLNNHKWTREIYLARNREPINIAQSFPTGNQYIIDPVNSFFEIVDVLPRPGSETISTVVLSIINTQSGETSEKIFSPTQQMIDQGKITFPMQNFSLVDGRYGWKVDLMEDSRLYLYPNLGYDYFIVDTTPPQVTFLHGYSSPYSPERNRMVIRAGVEDNINLKRTEIYFEGQLLCTRDYPGIVFSDVVECYSQEGLKTGTYTVKVIVEDMAGFKSERTESFPYTAYVSLGTSVEVQRGVHSSRTIGEITTKHIQGTGAHNQYQTKYIIREDVNTDIGFIIEFPRRIGENGPQFYNFIFTDGQSPTVEILGCMGIGGDVCRARVTQPAGKNGRIVIYYSDQVTISGTSEISVIKIGGELNGFEQGNPIIRITAHNPVNAVLAVLKERIYVGTSWYRPTGWEYCDETWEDNDFFYCRIIEDPYTYKLVRVTYVLGMAPYMIEVKSQLDGEEIEGVLIKHISGHPRPIGDRETTFLLSFDACCDVIALLEAPERHENRDFFRWEGCKWAEGRQCYAKQKTRGVIDTVTAIYGGDFQVGDKHVLNILKQGSGTISSADGMINCEPNCSVTYEFDSLVELTANPEPGWELESWSGFGTEYCSGPTCQISMTSDRTITAVFRSLNNVLNIESSPISNISITSSPAGLEGNTPYVIERVEDINHWFTAPQLITQGGEEYAFISWSNCRQVGSNPRNCGVTLVNGQESTVTANYELVQHPTARISCQITDCRGPDCFCNSGTWQTYPTAVFQVNNASTDPKDSINRSVWRILNNLGELEEQRIYNEKRDWGAFQFPVGNYTIELTVENQAGFSDNTSQQIRVKKDINVDFECSLDQEDWTDDCESLIVFEEQELYLRDISTPSEGASISSWTWRLNGRVVGSGSIISINVSEVGENTIVLRVQDTIGRTGEATKTINVKMGLPEWKEIKPF